MTELPPLRSLGNLGDVMTDPSGSGATTLNLLDTLLRYIFIMFRETNAVISCLKITKLHPLKNLNLFRLDGPFSISGRTLVIYSGQEDSTGSTGRAVSCGVIKQVPLE